MITRTRRDRPAGNLSVLRKRARRLPKITILDNEERWDPRNEDEFLWWPRIQWIDPGVVSGVAVVWFDPIALFAGSKRAEYILAYSEILLSGPENGPNGQINRFLRMARTLGQEHGHAIGTETFTPRQLNMDEAFLSPVRIREGIEFSLSISRRLDGNVGIPLLTQSPSDALSTFNNDRLKAIRMYTPGPDHVNDAKRHTLLHLSRLQQLGWDELFRLYGNEPGWRGEDD